MNREKFNGIFVPVISPLSPDGGLDVKAMEKVIRYVYEKGVDGLYVCGATGDAYYMNVEERKQAAELAYALSKEYGKTCIVHIGAYTTRDAVELAKHASALGVDAVSSMPISKSTRLQRRKYYEAVTEAAGETPFLIYYIPNLTLDLSIDELLELLEFKNVIGLKFSDPNYFYQKRLLIHKPDLVVFNGCDELLVFGLLSGATGGIGMNYNAFPELFIGIYDCFRKGDIKSAMKLQDALSEYLDPVFEYGLHQSCEYTLGLRFGSDLRCFREPNIVRTLTDEQKAVLEEKTKYLDGVIAEVLHHGEA